MRTLFLDCFDDMVPLWQAVAAPGDPAVTVNIAPGQPDDIPALLAGHAVCIVDHSYFDAALLGRCPDLRHIVFLGTGAGSFIDLAAAERHGITVHTIKGYGDTTVAEHTIALALAAARGVARMDREVRVGQWRQVEGLQIFGKTLGIIGLGGIGREVARMGQGLGMKVLAWNRSPLDNPAAPLAPLETVLAEADILCLTLALNDGTRGFLDAGRLAMTRRGVIFVNTARADIVDNAALAALLREGHVRHAAIDVFSQEPPAADDPLLGLENVTLTAHAGFMTPEATMTMLRRALDIVKGLGG
ncbi:2-hydroxyacid dehydrogenase [Roseomonas sp. USHLN139]|uniref:2-hydroxyacid dehydrogenase n=1 Tax=Roseomonas sp. USHLN139 TaxID=3081298 RepID=UPI003B01625C